MESRDEDLDRIRKRRLASTSSSPSESSSPTGGSTNLHLHPVRIERGGGSSPRRPAADPSALRYLRRSQSVRRETFGRP
jgi:hypothetical protein